MARYAAYHLAGALGRGQHLEAESFRKLHSAGPGHEYALGWLVVARGWAGGEALTHAGSNTMFYSVIWIAPRKDFALVVATNLGGDPAAQGCDETAKALIGQFL